MKQYLIIALILIPCLLSAATSKIDFEKGTDFSKYKTYAWGKAQEGDAPEQPLDTTLAKAVETALSARGWSLVTGPADVILTRDLRVVADDRVTSFSSGIGNGIGMGSGDYQRAGLKSVEVKTLSLTFTDPATQKQVWKAVISQDVLKNPPAKIEKGMLDEVQHAFAKFPPGSKK